MEMTKWNTQELLAVPGDFDHPRNSEAAIVELLDGRLLLAWSEFYEGEGEDWSPCRIAMKTSSDNGLTWSETGILLDNESVQSTMEVDFLRLPNNDLCLFYCKKNSNDDCRVMMRKSSDDGTTWSEPKQLSNWHGYVALTNDRSILTSTGRIVLPFWYDIQDAFQEPWYCVAQVLYSDDLGETWNLSMPPLAAPYSKGGTTEPAVVELSDGSIMMFMRNDSGRIWQAISPDGGARWERPTPTELGSSASPICLKRIPNTNDIMVIWNQCSKKELEWGFQRSRLSCAISSDDGKTWGHFKNLESLDDITHVEPTPIGEGPVPFGCIWDSPIPPNGPLNCSYPSCTFVGDKVIITYDFPTDVCSLKMRILPLSWFYDDEAESFKSLASGEAKAMPKPV
jgi:predicted neuraminidase